VDNFIENEPIPSIEDEYQIMQQMTPMLPVDMVNMVAKGLISETDTNLVVLAVLNEKEGRVYPTKTDLAEAVTGVRSEKLEAYVDNVKQEPLMTAMPKKGKIVEGKTGGWSGLQGTDALQRCPRTDQKDRFQCG